MTTALLAPSLRRPTVTGRILLAAIAVSHVVVPLVMLARRSELQDEIRDHHHDFTAAEVARSTSVAIDTAVGFHAVLAVLCVFLILALPSHRRRIVRLTIVSQVAAIAFSVVSWAESAMFHAVIPIVDALSLGVIVCAAVIWSRTAPRVQALP